MDGLRTIHLVLVFRCSLYLSVFFRALGNDLEIRGFLAGCEFYI